MEKEIEMKFIEQTLQSWGARLQSALIKEISSKDLISKTGSKHLKDSISYQVTRTGINGYHLELYFPDYGRYIEIRYNTGRSSNSEKAFGKKNSAILGKGSSVASKAMKRNTIGSRFGRKNKDTRWYSKTAYGSVNSLIGQLMYGLNDSVLETLKEQLNQPI
jgi:hypothetical protein